VRFPPRQFAQVVSVAFVLLASAHHAQATPVTYNLTMGVGLAEACRIGDGEGGPGPVTCHAGGGLGPWQGTLVVDGELLTLTLSSNPGALEPLFEATFDPETTSLHGSFRPVFSPVIWYFAFEEPVNCCTAEGFVRPPPTVGPGQFQVVNGDGGLVEWGAGGYRLTRVGGDDDEREVPQPPTLALLALGALLMFMARAAFPKENVR
jgi:hypothetical protein